MINNNKPQPVDRQPVDRQPVAVEPMAVDPCQSIPEPRKFTLQDMVKNKSYVVDDGNGELVQWGGQLAFPASFENKEACLRFAWARQLGPDHRIIEIDFTDLKFRDIMRADRSSIEAANKKEFERLTAAAEEGVPEDEAIR